MQEVRSCGISTIAARRPGALSLGPTLRGDLGVEPPTPGHALDGGDVGPRKNSTRN